MKKKLTLFAALISIFAASCTKEQSELSMDQLTGTATICGLVEYNSGSEIVVNSGTSTVKDNVLLAAANQTVYITVAYSEYDLNNSGSEIIEVQTDQSGKFTATVKVPSNIAKVISAEVNVREFNATYKEVQTIDGNLVVNSINDVMFVGTPVTASGLIEGKTVYVEVKATATPEMID